jgi:hypothetical protein
MDETTHFALTIILAFVIGILFGVGNRVVAESNGREEKTGNNELIDLMLMLFWFVALGYILAVVWHIKLVSFVFFVIIASVFFGAAFGAKLALVRNETFVQLILACSGIGVPIVFHFVL